MSDYSDDLKENGNLKNSDSESEEGNGDFKFFDKILLFQSSSNQFNNTKTKANNFLPLPSKSIDDKFASKKMITADTSDKSDINVLTNEDQNYMEHKVTLNVNKSCSPKKKRLNMNILGQEKTKTPNKKISVFQKTKTQKANEKNERKDINGTIINKKNKKKVKISFHTPFEHVVDIASFKKFNVISGQPKKDVFIKQRDDCRCCSIW